MNEFNVRLLDHGSISLIESWGSDQMIIETARQSTDGAFKGWGPIDEGPCPICKDGVNVLQNGGCAECGFTGRKLKPGDEKLLRFLHEHKHSTPFEFAGLTIEVKAPLMVFREWHRHRVPFGYSEVSARYVPLPNENYCPTIERVIEGAKKAGRNKQAQSVDNKIPHQDQVELWLDFLNESYEKAQAVYEAGLKIGIPKELARLPVPVGRYSRMRATGNLRGWLGFMTLRMAPNAQEEIRVYANQVGEMVKLVFPRTWELFAEGMK